APLLDDPKFLKAVGLPIARLTAIEVIATDVPGLGEFRAIREIRKANPGAPFPLLKFCVDNYATILARTPAAAP
ncbi:MAG TPA: hypothetical protein VGP44_05120, partial [Gemmatimonadales bacterium]|nr:hypothetical protein [Gemmatimonadales bacterium]